MVINQIIEILGVTLHLDPYRIGLKATTPLLGAIPELDSMAVVSVIAALEERFDISVAGDEIDGRAFETLGSLVAFVEGKLAS